MVLLLFEMEHNFYLGGFRIHNVVYVEFCFWKSGRDFYGEVGKVGNLWFGAGVDFLKLDVQENQVNFSGLGVQRLWDYHVPISHY